MILWLSIAGLWLIAFLFSGMEAGLLSLNRVRLRNRVKHRDRNALRLQKLLRQPERLLLTVVIVTNLASICAITLGTASLVGVLGPAGFAAAFVLFLPLYLFGLELFPKALFRRFPTYALAFLSTPLRFAFLALGPFFRLAKMLGQPLLRTRDNATTKLFAARDDFKYVTLESEHSGAITAAQRRLIHGVVDFHAVTARDLMQPLSDFPTTAHGANVAALAAASCRGSRETFLAVSESGEILGLIPLFDLTLSSSAPETKISPYIRHIPPVKASESALHILRKMRNARARAVLVMEGNTPLGLVLADTVTRRLVAGG
ncbi:MAG: CNNM domain-containing protein [Chthoniobacteraceae bacterium]|nr:CNNM domain-containing protein [Chthoniobacteraceae bacterium]